MGLFSKLFNNMFIEKKYNIDSCLSLECKELMKLNDIMMRLLDKDEYIAKSCYLTILSEKKDIVDFFVVLDNSDVLKTYCKKNNVDIKIVKKIIDNYFGFEKIIEEHNEQYIQNTMNKEQEYLDNILANVDPNIKLDEDQRRVVLTDEDYCLVIAGAGAGKTTTVAAKVKYLVEKKKIKSSQILVVSFTNKAVSELREKVNRDLEINCPITTFHAAGHAILRKQNTDNLNIVDNSKLYYVLQDYFQNSLLKNESLVNNIVLFFASYIDTPFEGDDINNFFNNIAKSNYSTMRSDLDEFKQRVINIRSKKAITIQSEVLRSSEEVKIANFLYLNNIEYSYEPIYKYEIASSKKPYTPDFMIKQGDKIAYIEHFGITQSGENNLYNNEQLQKYKVAINDKIKLHRKHATNLIYTFSKYKDGRGLLEHLEEELIKNGFVLNPRSNQEVMEKIIASEENRYIRKLINLICRFITNFKTNGYDQEEFKRMYLATKNVRTKLFLEICHECYLEYECYLKENNAVDFEDMINESAKVLRQVKEMKQNLDFKYIIVDEYQDISRQRFDLVTALAEVTDAKIIAVGDDWQSIYAFSGSDITLFTKFEEKMGYAKLLKIVKTYRNSQEVIDIAGNFIQKNDSQITKVLKSPKNITDPVIIYTYDASYKNSGDNNKSGKNYALAYAVQTAIEQIMTFNRKEGKPENSSILLLGRFGFDGDKLEKSGLFEYKKRGNKIKCVKYPKLNITIMTAHASKGLGYDNVIVINGKNEIYGFPSKIEDDPVLSLVVKEDKSMIYAEERRLFYVAMTRTKNRVYFVAPLQNPSEFLLELKHDYKNVILKGEWNENTITNNKSQKKCPVCGYPLQYRYKNSFGLKLYICTNEPELCGFMTNDYRADKLSIIKCNQCRDGYLVIKPGKDTNFILGCTNYKKDGTGCNNIVTPKQYYEMFDIKSKIIEKQNNKKIQFNEVKMSDEEVITIEKSTINNVIYQGYDLNDVVYYILQCLVNVSKNHYYGKYVLIKVLKGSQDKQILKNNLNDCQEYGCLKKLKNNQLLIIIEWLINEKYILQTNHPTYPVLHPTYEGMHYKECITRHKLGKLRDILICKDNENK